MVLKNGVLVAEIKPLQCAAMSFDWLCESGQNHLVHAPADQAGSEIGALPCNWPLIDLTL
jgi:hypothetical protein